MTTKKNLTQEPEVQGSAPQDAPPQTALASTMSEEEKAKRQQVAAYGQDVELSPDIGSDEKLVPFVRIIQSNSPQVDPSDAKYIETAKPGMLLNTATGELYSMLALVVAWRDHNYVEYVPRDNGGGFVSIWPSTDDRIPALRQRYGQFGKLPLESGNELTETYYMMGPAVGKLLDGTATEPFETVVGFASTQIKKYKMTMNRLSMLVGSPRRLPDFAYRWMLVTVPEKNKKGKFFGWKIVLDGESAQQAFMAPDHPLVRRAREFAAGMREDTMRPDYAGGVEQPPAEEVGGGEPAAEGEEEAIPMA